MKKKLSFLTAIAIALSMVPAFMNVSAANTDLSKTETFDGLASYDVYPVEDTGYEQYGNAMKIKHTPALNLVWNFPRQTSGKLLFSFDAFLKPDATLKFISYDYVNEGLMIFSKGYLKTWVLTNEWTDNVSLPQGNVAYPTNRWMHFDMVLDLDANTEEYYIDGLKVADFTFDRTSEHSSYATQTEAIVKAAYDSIQNISIFAEVEEDVGYLDNVLITPINDAGQMTAKPVGDTIAVGFSDYIEDLTADMFTLEFIPSGTNDNMDIELDAKEINGTSIKLIPEFLEAGTYKLKMADGVTGRWGATFNNQVASFTVTQSAGGGSQVSNNFEYFFDFENGAPANTYTNNWAVVDDPTNSGRGKVMKSNANGSNTYIPIGAKTTNGDYYLYSLDVYTPAHNGGNAIFMLLDGATSTWQPVGAYALGQFSAQVEWGPNTTGTAVTTGTWHRVDMLFTQTGQKNVTMWIDGNMAGSYSLGIIGGTYNPTDHFAIFDSLGTDCERLMVDNITFKKVDVNGTPTYNADATVTTDGDIVLTFDETTYVENQNVKLWLAQDSNSDFEEVGYTVLYNNGTKAILRPGTDVSTGILKIDLSGAKSFANHPADNTEFIMAPEGTVGDVNFVTAMGKTVAGGAIAPDDTKSITIELLSGLLNNDVANADVLFIDGNGDDVNFTPSYDPTTKIYTMTFDNLLGDQNDYELVFNGKTESDVDYDEYELMFQTEEGELGVKKLRISKTQTSGTVKLDYNNSLNQGGTYYVIFAGYEGNLLKVLQYQTLTISGNAAEQDKTFTFTDANIASCDKVSAYIWNGFENVAPLVKSITR